MWGGSGEKNRHQLRDDSEKTDWKKYKVTVIGIGDLERGKKEEPHRKKKTAKRKMEKRGEKEPMSDYSTVGRKESSTKELKK